MSNKMKVLFGVLIAVLLVAAVFAVVSMNMRHDVMEDISEVKEYAENLYAAGDVESAIYQMEVYCTYVAADVDARATLGDWYMESGDEEMAYECYYNAALNKGLTEERIPSLSVKNTEEIVLEPVKDVVMEITPDVRVTKDMRLTITGHNLVPEGVFEGRINSTERELSEEEGCYTTDWFSVDPMGAYLTMSGGFNCAVWQFRNADGEITHSATSINMYRAKNTYDVNVYQMARAVIPEKTAWCRVTYYDSSREDITAALDEELTIVYGRLPGESRAADYATYEIPDLQKGEKIVYTNGAWSHIKNGEVIPLDDWSLPSIERGSYIAISGTLPGRVSFGNSSFADFNKEGIYTIRFDVNNPSAMGERMDDAKNLGFNAAVAEGTIALGENHFDSIYPWKDIRLCNVKNGEVVAYEGEADFSSSGSNGDVFVEIPKFYVRRVVDENYDTISVSGVCHEGFEVDEAFLTPEGEADKIYIAAYLTSVDENGNAVSAADTNPALSLSPTELEQKAEEKGYKEMDYAALSALQKLFLVETGLRNSQYLYMGTCGYTMATADGIEPNYAVAVTDNSKTNCIVVSSEYSFEAGNSIIIFDAQNYEKTIDAAYDDVKVVKTVIKNNDDTQSVYISGDPIEVKANVTAIAHTALANGTTRSVGGHTGAMSTARGTVAFKYRNIENLWGNAYVYIDGVRINDRVVTLAKRTGESVQLGYLLPERISANVVDNMIKTIGYDVNAPQVMLPTAVGDGATISTYYGDAYIGGEDGEDCVLHFGGGWNSQACSGLFNYVTSSKADETHTNTTGRMMYVK